MANPDNVQAMAAAGPERRDVVLGDGVRGEGTLSVLDWGGPANAPAVQLSHANGFNAYTYQRLIEPIADKVRLQAADFRGHGFTTLQADPAMTISWNTFRDDLIAYLEQRGEPVLLVGHSLGGTTSLLTAEARPDLVRGVLAVEPVIQPFLQAWIMRGKRLLGLPHKARGLAEGAAKRRAVFPDREAVFNAYKNKGAFTSWPDETLHDYIAGGVRDREDGQVELCCAPAWESLIFASSGSYIWDRLARIEVPLTLVRGSLFSTCPDPVVNRLQRLYPQADFITVDGATHFLPMERPDIVRAQILRMSGISS